MCCGKNRQQFTPLANQAGRGLPMRPASKAAPGQRDARAGQPHGPHFEYTGRTGMTVVGPATGLRYRFDRPGARIQIDPRDRALLASVQNLRPAGS